jgi:hypothetical protein
MIITNTILTNITTLVAIIIHMNINKIEILININKNNKEQNYQIKIFKLNLKNIIIKYP